MNRFEKYLKVVTWAQRRYTDSSGLLVAYIGTIPSKYTRIEQAFARKYLGVEV
jgi:hypothetical protein